MNLWGSPEFKVGVLVVAISGLIGMMSLKVSEGPGFLSAGKSYSFIVDNAGGLVPKSAVKMAGIKVGTIEEIELAEGGRAKVSIALNRGVPFTTSSRVELRSDGILGDKHVELIPGNPNDPELANRSIITNTNDKAGLDNVMSEVGKISKNLNVLIDNLNKATGAGEGDDSTPIGRIIKNIERVSRDMAEITGENKEKLHEIIDRVASISKSLDRALDDQNLAHINASLKNIDEITSKINRGEGTVGRLINDEHTVEQINTAIENVNTFIGGANRWETSLDFHTEVLADEGMAKSYLGFRLQPGLDRYYELQVVDDPKGVTKTTDTDTTTGGVTTSEKEVKTYKSQVKFTALFAKNFYDLTLKGGLIENSGGLGIDYHLFNRKLRFSVEAFDFSDPYVRAFVRYNFYKGIYITGGADNVLNRDKEFSSFVGAGLFITNDDLKILASKISL